MHELGIVFYIIRDVKQAACWRWAADKEAMLKGCELKILPIPAVTHCDGCGKDYPTVANGKTCPHCGSTDTWLLRGNEVEIKEIVVNTQ